MIGARTRRRIRRSWYDDGPTDPVRMPPSNTGCWLLLCLLFAMFCLAALHFVTSH